MLRSLSRTLATTLGCAWALAPLTLQAQNVAVVYHSQSGNTRLLAEAVAAGAGGVTGSQVRLLPVETATIDDLRWAHAVVLGSPVHTANMSPQMADFINRMPFDGTMRDKVGAAFVTAGGISAGEELAQMAILHAMLIYGFVVVGGPEWTGALGASAITEEGPFAPAGGESPALDPLFLAKGEALGRRVAEVALKLRWGR